MDLKTYVEQVLKQGNAPAGYTLTEADDGQVIVEYPGGVDVLIGTTPGREQAVPSQEITTCTALLEAAGLHVFTLGESSSNVLHVGWVA